MLEECEISWDANYKDTYAIVVACEERSVTILTSRTKDRVPSVELCCGNAIVACKLAAVVTRYCLSKFVAVGNNAGLCWYAGCCR